MLVVDPVGIGARYVVAWLAAGVLAVAGRYAFDFAVGLSSEPTETLPPLSFSGPSTRAHPRCRRWRLWPPQTACRVVGLVLPDGDARVGSDPARAPPIVASYEHLSEALSATGATQVILADPASLNGQLQSVMDACRDGGVALKVVSLGLQQHPDVVTYIPGLDCPLFVVRPQPAGVPRTGGSLGPECR